ncbi:DUF1176 domain-containing protein [Shewanella khirikhana]|uniref:DUF1176 domain-containing protein n=1 Tax=Shewanella khirikhana TaxID=1965282 RepID=UPI0030D44840
MKISQPTGFHGIRAAFAVAFGLIPTLASMVASPLASAFEGERFYHKDWLLACDNTGTCRAAGYSAEGNRNAVALMFTRQAGPATDISAKVFLGDFSELEPWPTEINLYIDGQELGPVAGELLSSVQVQALLAVMTRDARIEIGDGKANWLLSGSGASAVFRKMDEYQGRQGTPFAVVAKGNKPESSVKAPQPLPKIINKANKGELRPVPKDSAQYNELVSALRNSIKDGENIADVECQQLFAEGPDIATVNIGQGYTLIEASCWLAAYNYGSGYWLLADGDKQPRPLPVSGNDYADGIISAAHKGRGIGDCWSFESWVFDGTQMVKAGISDTGMCRGIAAGGIDPMPTYVSEVISNP